MNGTDYFDDDVDDALDTIMLGRLAGGDAPEMDIDAYRQLVRAVTPPTNGQIEAFADYVAAAHSWYKHLPMQPPGVDFHFYIDPNAGMDHLVHASGEVTVRARTPDTESFHYSWMTTADYRDRFGCLAFACGMGSTVFSDEKLFDETVLVDNNCHHPVLQLACDTAMTLPKDVLDAGTCSLTALVHPRSTADFLVMRLAMKKWKQPKQLEPGDDLSVMLQKHCYNSQDDVRTTDEDTNRVSTDPVFIALIEHEKARLRRSMIEAMQRMRSVAFADSQPSDHGDLK